MCETAQKIVAKAILFITCGDIQDAAGSLQLCAGQIAGADIAVHATREAFASDNTEAVLLVDAVGPEAERKSVCKERRKKARQRKHERGKKDKGL